MATHQNEGISLRIVVKDISLFVNKDIQDKKSNKTKKTNDMM